MPATAVSYDAPPRAPSPRRLVAPCLRRTPLTPHRLFRARPLNPEPIHRSPLPSSRTRPHRLPPTVRPLERIPRRPRHTARVRRTSAIDHPAHALAVWNQRASPRWVHPAHAVAIRNGRASPRWIHPAHALAIRNRRASPRWIHPPTPCAIPQPARQCLLHRLPDGATEPTGTSAPPMGLARACSAVQEPFAPPPQFERRSPAPLIEEAAPPAPARQTWTAIPTPTWTTGRCPPHRGRGDQGALTVHAPHSCPHVLGSTPGVPRTTRAAHWLVPAAIAVVILLLLLGIGGGIYLANRRGSSRSARSPRPNLAQGLTQDLAQGHTNPSGLRQFRRARRQWPR